MITLDSVYCEACRREHQTREHAIPCRRCHAMTVAIHGVCAECQNLAADAAEEVGLPTPRRLA